VISSGDCLRLPLPAPAEQTHRAEAGGEEWECAGKWDYYGRPELQCDGLAGEQ